MPAPAACRWIRGLFVEPDQVVKYPGRYLLDGHVARPSAGVDEDERLVQSAVHLGGDHALRLRDLGAVTRPVPFIHQTDGMPTRAKGR